MFGLGKKKTISVEYVEAGKRQPMSTAKVPTGDLPDVFEIDSVMEYDGKKWTIVAAVPETKEEFAKAGKLQLFLSKVVQLVPPGDAPFSLPTINDEIGLVRPAELHENVFVVHEDDWRQVEFVARSHAETVQRELREIRKIVDTQQVKGGYKMVHVRKTIPQPLAGTGLTTGAIKETFGIRNHFEGIVITGYNGRVENGFAYDVGGSGVLWGETDGKGNLLCLSLAASQENPGAAIKTLGQDVAAFCSKHKLQLVNWTAMSVLPK
jgi:hypothetical protein